MKHVMTLGVAAALACGCGATSSSLKTLSSTSYDASFDAVWKAATTAVAQEYPTARVLDPKARRIVSCWRPIDRDPTAARQAVANWRFFRVVVEISEQAPFRVAVAGRAAEYTPPIVRPLEHGGFEEPGWVDGRAGHVAEAIHEQLKASARPATGDAPAAADPATPENDIDTCVLEREMLGRGTAFNAGRAGIPIVAPAAP